MLRSQKHIILLYGIILITAICPFTSALVCTCEGVNDEYPSIIMISPENSTTAVYGEYIQLEWQYFEDSTGHESDCVLNFTLIDPYGNIIFDQHNDSVSELPTDTVYLVPSNVTGNTILGFYFYIRYNATIDSEIVVTDYDTTVFVLWGGLTESTGIPTWIYYVLIGALAIGVILIIVFAGKKGSVSEDDPAMEIFRNQRPECFDNDKLRLDNTICSSGLNQLRNQMYQPQQPQPTPATLGTGDIQEI